MSTHAHKLRGLGGSPVSRAPGAMSVRFAALGGVVYFGLILAFLSLFSEVPKTTDSTIGYATTATFVLSGVAIVLDSVWMFLVSLFLWRDPTLALPST